MNNEALAGTNLAFSTPSIALVWMLDVPEAGADWMFSIEERICRNGQTSGSAAVGRMLGRTQGASHDRLACGGRRLRDDLNALSLHRYFCGRNAFYPLNDQGNPLISQQMRPPSGRTMPTPNYLNLRRFFPNVTNAKLLLCSRHPLRFCSRRVGAAHRPCFGCDRTPQSCPYRSCRLASRLTISKLEADAWCGSHHDRIVFDRADITGPYIRTLLADCSSEAPFTGAG